MNVTRLPPGVTFEREQGLYTLTFRLIYKTKDVNNPENDTTVRLLRDIDKASYHKSLLPDIVADMLKQLYIHEIEEWLTIDNKRWREPHP